MREACPECGAALDHDAAACPRCGTLQDVELCPACQGALPSEAERCPACGSELFEKEPEPRSGHIEVSRKLVTVFSGPREAALAMQAALAGGGLQVHIADHNTRSLDPTMPGGNVFGFDLQAPVEVAETARRAVEQLRSNAASAHRDWAPPLSDDERLRHALERTGRRICWSACLVLTAPYALWLGIRYVPGAMRMRPRPRGHIFALAALVLAAGTTASVVLFSLVPA